MKGAALSLTLSKTQIEHSPDIRSDQPVSRQIELNLYDLLRVESSLGRRRLLLQQCDRKPIVVSTALRSSASGIIECRDRPADRA